MVIHVFIAHMHLGGAERVCVNLANAWAAKGHEVHIAVLNLDGDINTQNLDDSVQVHSFGVSRLRYAFVPFYKYVRKYKPPFMLVFGNDAAVIVQKLRDLHLIDTPLIVRMLNNANITLAKEDGVSPIVDKYLKKAQSNLRKMDHVVAQCEAMGHQLVDMGLVGDDRLSVIFNPVDERLLLLVKDKTDKIETDGTDSSKEIVFIGRIDPQKNPVDLVRAYAKVRETVPNVKLRLVGKGVLGDAVREEADRLGVLDGIIFDDIRTDMENVYAHAAVVALTSNYEGMPNCLIEAIGCGVPVVSYDCPMGPAEIVTDGVNGYLVPMGDVDMMADRLTETLIKDWNREAIRQTCSKFHVENAAGTYIDIFNKVSKDKR